MARKAKSADNENTLLNSPPAVREAPPIAVSIHQTSLTLVLLQDIVCDPELQARAKGLNPEVVKEYAAAIKGGASFPPVEIVRELETGKLLLVDGWHRHAAYSEVGTSNLTAHIVPGTRRDAMLAAASANSAHGLQRTHEDKRRSVRLLLADPEIAKLSGRKVGALAGTSHTYVDEVRKHYDLQPGAPLTAAIRQSVDGEPTEAWIALLATIEESWIRAQAEKIRKAPSIVALAAPAWASGATQDIKSDARAARAAVALRLSELQDQPWPWGGEIKAIDEVGMDEAAFRVKVAAEIDTEEHAVLALRSIGGTGSEASDLALLCVLSDVANLTSDYGWYQFERMAGLWAGRQGLLDRLTDARRAHAARKQADPAERAMALAGLREDVDAQRAAFEAADEDTRLAISPNQLNPDIRNNDYRSWVAADHHTEDCRHPMCSGWVRTYTQEEGVQTPRAACVSCQRTPAEAQAAAQRDIDAAANWIGMPGVSLLSTVYDNAGPVDADTMRLLSLLRTEVDAHAAWLAKVPAEVRSALNVWRDRGPSTWVGGGPRPAPVRSERVDGKTDDSPVFDRLDLKRPTPLTIAPAPEGDGEGEGVES